MRKLTPELKNEIIELIQKGLSSVEIAAKLGVSPAQVMAVKAHITMGTYGVERKIEKLTPELKNGKIEYFVYVNHPNNKAVVHNSNCSFFLVNKVGMQTENGYWQGPFSTLNDACNFAKSTGKQTVKCCEICLKNSNCCQDVNKLNF